MILRCLLRAACVAAFAGLAAPASADPMTFANLSNVRYEVVDLTPDDGIDASFFFTQEIFNAVYLNHTKNAGVSFETEELYGFTPQTLGWNTALASISGNANGYALSSEASANGDWFSATANFLHWFQLGPNTRVTFTADWNAGATWNWPASGSSNVALGVNTGGDTVFANGGAGYETALKQGSLSLTAESGQDQLDGYLWAMAASMASDETVAAVPEPGSIGLLLAGLAGVAYMRRRQLGKQYK